MDTIKYYFRENLVGKAQLPEMSLSKDRHRIARENGVSIYDHFEIYNKDGEIRISCKAGKYGLWSEFNIET